jgi:hypothetical protein
MKGECGIFAEWLRSETQKKVRGICIGLHVSAAPQIWCFREIVGYGKKVPGGIPAKRLKSLMKCDWSK